jgi:hypothetical protein
MDIASSFAVTAISLEVVNDVEVESVHACIYGPLHGSASCKDYPLLFYVIVILIYVLKICKL